MRRSDAFLGIACPMANESAEGGRFVAAVLDKCTGFKQVKFFAVVDSASRDDTVEVMRGLSDRDARLQLVWAPENRCVVDAYVRGYREALGAGCDWVLEIDAGFSHQPDEIPQFFDAMERGYHCVFGSRFVKGGAIRDSSLRRKIVSWGGTQATNFLLGTRLSDMTSGFELFSAEALEYVLSRGIRSRGPFFQTEIKFHCRGMNLVELPITYRNATGSVGTGELRESFEILWSLYKESRIEGAVCRSSP